MRCYWCSKPLDGELAAGESHLKCERDAWASNRQNGFIILLFLMPLAVAGFVVGCLASAVKAGFLEGLGLWKTSQEFVRKPRP